MPTDDDLNVTINAGMVQERCRMNAGTASNLSMDDEITDVNKTGIAGIAISKIVPYVAMGQRA